MRPRESVVSVFAVLCLSFLLFALAGTTPTASVAYADNSSSTELPADSCGDTTYAAVGCDDSDEESIIDVLTDVLDAVL